MRFAMQFVGRCSISRNDCLAASHRDLLPMNAPDFSKYNEIQLKQVLTRIDRERFPERVAEIEARLGAFRLTSSAESLAPNTMGTEQESNKTLERGGGTLLLWLLAFVLLITLFATSFTVQLTNAAREKWFENQARMEQHGVVVDAVIVAKACAGRTVRYSWKWGDKQLQGGGRSCNSTCSDAKIGDQVQIRFVPTNPGDVRCAQDDIETKIGPPNYYDPILFVILIVALCFGPFILLCHVRPGAARRRFIPVNTRGAAGSKH